MLPTSKTEGSKIPYALIAVLLSLGLIYAGWSVVHTTERQFSCYDCGMKTEPQHCELLPASEYWPQVEKHLGYCFTDLNPYPGHEWRLEETVWDDSKNPLTEIPPHLEELDDELVSQYSLGNRTLIRPKYTNHVLQQQNQTTLERIKLSWSAKNIAKGLENVLNGKKSKIGSYGTESHNLFATMKTYGEFVKNKSGTIIGSQRPWAEVYALAAGAKKLTTIEYTVIDTDIPMIRRLHPSEVPDEFYAGALDFDFAVSFSSIEHSGLGRYGDPIDPAGDFKAMGQISCMVKPGGLLFLAVPFSWTDCVVFNAHRVYGPIRIPYMLENWRFIDFTGAEPSDGICSFTQGVMVLQNMRSCSNGWDFSE